MYNSEVWHEREGDNGEGDPRALLEGEGRVINQGETPQLGIFLCRSQPCFTFHHINQ